MLSKPHMKILADALRLSGNDGVSIGISMQVSTYINADFSPSKLQALAASHPDAKAIQIDMAKLLRRQIDDMSDEHLAELINTSPDGGNFVDSNTCKGLSEAVYAACESAGVDLSEAQEPEIAGMWDWRDRAAGEACGASLNSKFEAALDAFHAHLGVERLAQAITNAVEADANQNVSTEPRPQGG